MASSRSPAIWRRYASRHNSIACSRSSASLTGLSSLGRWRRYCTRHGNHPCVLPTSALLTRASTKSHVSNGPPAKSAPRCPRGRALALHPQPAMAPKVLVIEDREYVRQVLVAVLVDAGYQTVGLPSAITALERLAE